MDDPRILAWLARLAVAGVWTYEGLWCKLLVKSTHELEVVEAMPFFPPGTFGTVLKMLGVAEVMIAIWSFSGVSPVVCAMVQTLLLMSLNFNGLLFAGKIIHEPLGMIVRNFSFLVLVWLSAGLRV